MAAPVFSLYDGTTTVQLNSAPVYTVAYNANSPAMDVRKLESASVEESIELVITGATTSAIQTSLRAIEALVQAVVRRRERQGGPKVYLLAQLDMDAATWRAELKNARIVAENVADDLTKKALNVMLTFERDYAWEGAEVELGLASQGYAKATGGRTITMNGIDNWLAIDGADVTGTLPGCTRLRLQNTVAANRAYSNFFIGNNAFSDAVNFVGLVQAETATGKTPVADATCSGGNGVDIVLTTSPVYVSWLVPAAMMTYGLGRYFRPILRTTGGVAFKVQPMVLENFAIQTLWEGGAIDVVTQIADLGSVAIPPLPNLSGQARVNYTLKMWVATSTVTPRLDYFNFLGTDSFLRVVMPGMTISQNDYVEFDSIEWLFYSIESSEKHPILVPFGEPLTVFPGVNQRLRIVFEASTQAITDTVKAQLWYRPRRSIL